MTESFELNGKQVLSTKTITGEYTFTYFSVDCNVNCDDVDSVVKDGIRREP